MSVRGGVALAVSAGLLAIPSLAAAQVFTVSPSATATGGLAATYALYDDPSKSPTTIVAPIITLGPAIAMTYETPRTLHDLSAAVSATLPILGNFNFVDAPPSFTGHLTYTGKVALSPVSNVAFGFVLSALPLNALVTSVDAYAATLDATPSTFSYNLSANAHETLTRELSPSARLTETANVLYNEPYDPDPTALIRPTTLNAKGSLAYTHTFALDALIATAAVSYTRFGSAEGTNAEPRDQFVNTLIGTWHHPLTASLTSSVDLGVLQAVSPQSTAGVLWQPTGGVKLTYTLDPANVSIGYIHGATVNVFNATINMSDQAILRAAIPFGATGLALSTSAGFTRSTPIALDGSLTGGSDIYLADLAFNYSPVEIPKLIASVRGSFNRQIPIDNPIAGTTRLALNVNIGFAFPNTKAVAAAQSRLSPAYVPTPTLGSDSTPAPGVQPSPVEIVESEAQEAASSAPPASSAPSAPPPKP